MNANVPMHPEVTDDPQEVRWVIPAGTLPLVGPVTDVPGALGDMMRAGTVAGVEVEPRAVRIRLSDGEAWAQHGARLWDALAQALREPQTWRPAAAVGGDEVLRATLQDVLDGPIGDYIRSHGGEIVIAGVQDGRAEVRMHGACAQCPAAGFTLHARLEAELRRRYPDLVELRAVEDRCHGFRPRWPTIRRRERQDGYRTGPEATGTGFP